MNTFDGRETANAPPADDIAAVNVPRLPAKMIGRGIEAAGTSVSREYYGNNSDNIPHLSPPNYETYHDKHGGAMKAHTKPPSMPYGDYVLAYNKDGVGKAAGSIGRSSNMHDNRTHAQTNRSSNQDWIVESLLDLKKISPGGYDDSTRSSGKAHAGTKRNGGHTGVADGSITRKLPFIDDIPDKYLPANVAKKQDIWNQRLTELIQFKKLHGHTNVPQKYENNTSLGAWVARNRIFMRQWEESPSSCSAYQAERVKILKKAGLLSNIGEFFRLSSCEPSRIYCVSSTQNFFSQAKEATLNPQEFLCLERVHETGRNNSIV